MAPTSPKEILKNATDKEPNQNKQKTEGRIGE